MENREETQVIDQDGTIVILGAGPAGLACAHKLLSNGLDRKVVVLDRANVPGGAGASFKWKGHTLDYGPHAFHTRGDEPENLIRSLFVDNPESLISGRKRVSVFLKNKFFKYPLQIKEALLKFNPLLSVKIILEFMMTFIIHQLVSIPIESFEDWGRKRFGATLYKISFGDYTKKVWKTEPNLISRKFASEKIQGFSFINLIKKLLKIGGQVTEPYYQSVIYHKNGSGTLYMRLAEKIRELGGVIELEADIQDLKLDGDKVKEVCYLKDGEKQTLKTDFLVNTIQMPALVNLFGNQTPFIVRHHADKLKYVSLILVYLEFETDKIGDDSWFYLLDNEFVFNRVTEQKNLSRITMEEGKTVLSFELTCRGSEEYWQMSDQELYDLAISDCERIPKLANKLSKVTDFTVRRARNVYELYLKQFDSHAEIVLGYTQDIKNIISIGRRGLFLQGDMHQSVEMGLSAGDLIHNMNQDASRCDELKAEYLNKYVKYQNT
ncbi:MAG: NAD(P)-binding protein [Nitrospina sp.]|jgi:protoporphyrinogen oxidase|nr:NAD(P)-binding protein [Nitrospina sp.]MBT6718121.1 NAD(P)-binding protein [Nitrospina sp.]